MSLIDEKSKKIDSFVQLLLSTYAYQKQIYQKNKLSKTSSQYQIIEVKKRERNQQKTRSKSRKSKQTYHEMQVRKSLRINQKVNQIQKFIELQKQPLWHPNKRKKQLSKEKISLTPQLKIQQKTSKIKRTDPLYQFYSQYQPSQNNSESQKPLPQTDKNNEIENINKSNQPNQQQQNEKQLQNWNPSKKQASMLAIQTLIDQYIIFKQNMRNSNLVKLSQLINYIRQIKGYYFNLSVMQNILTINSKLYKITNVENQKYLRCGKLNLQMCKRRLIATKINMKRLDDELNKQVEK